VLPLYLAQNLSDARLLADQLEHLGIRTYVRNEALQGALGELPMTLGPEVCILDPHDLDEALSIVQEFERALKDTLVTADLLCSECGELSPGNFEICWCCRSPFPEH
jgi:cadmium resistance protein CadD (predicted permease)